MITTLADRRKAARAFLAWARKIAADIEHTDGAEFTCTTSPMMIDVAPFGSDMPEYVETLRTYSIEVRLPYPIVVKPRRKAKRKKGARRVRNR